MGNSTKPARSTPEPQALVHIRKAESFIAPALPKGVEFGALCEGMKVELARTPELREVDPTSLFWTFVHAAELGLRIGRVHEEAYALGFRKGGGPKLATLVIGYKGMVKLAYQHPLVRLVDAAAVRENDRFAFDGGTANSIQWQPELRGPRGKLLCAFAKIRVGTTADNAEWKIRVVTREEIEEAKRCSPRSNKPDSPWQRSPDSMAKKTAIRRALLDVPKSEALARVEVVEEAYDSGQQHNLIPLHLDASPKVKATPSIQHEQPPQPEEGELLDEDEAF